MWRYIARWRLEEAWARGFDRLKREKEMRELEATFEAAISEIEEAPEAKHIELTEVTVRARKSDFDLSPPVLLWTPWIIGDNGVARRG